MRTGRMGYASSRVMTRPIYVTEPDLPSLNELQPYLERIWETRRLTNGGPIHKELEKALADHFNVPHVALFNNATIALLVALRALEVTGEIITTPFSFVATTHAISWNGLVPVFADIDPVTLNLDPARIEEAITPHTSAILPVHCYGNRCDVDGIREVADRHGLRVIYDAAHAFGVEDDGGSVLRHGDLAVLSFHATKVFNTFEGGAIVCHDDEMKLRIDRLKNFGFVNETTVVATGINGKMNEFQAAIGLLQLRNVADALARRRALGHVYRQRLHDVRGLRCLPEAGQRVANYSYFPVFVGPEFPVGRDRLQEILRDQGIFARRYFYPLISEFPMYRDLPTAKRDLLPVAAEAADSVLCLPIYPAMTVADQDRVVGTIEAVGRSELV